jgi:hypothetical protein
MTEQPTDFKHARVGQGNDRRGHLDQIGRQISLLHRYFLNRTDRVAFAPPWEGDACPVDATDNLDALLADHLAGEGPPVPARWKTLKGKEGVVEGHHRLGTYSPAPGPAGLTRFGCVDCDGGGRHGNPLADPLGTALLILDALQRLGIVAYLERSGSGTGWHVWILFAAPVPASKVRALLFAVIPASVELRNGKSADVQANRGLEVFPKQDAVAADGLGNMVWLPFWHGAAEGANQFYRVEADGELRAFEPDDFDTATADDLDAALRELGPSTPTNRPQKTGTGGRTGRDGEGRVDPDALLERALRRVVPGSQGQGRNDSGFWLACQLRDNRYSEAEAEGVVVRFAGAAPGHGHPYTEREARATVRSAYSRPAREPWVKALHMPSRPSGDGGAAAPECDDAGAAAAAKKAKGKRPPSQAKVLLDVALNAGAEYFHTPDGRGYATVPLDGADGSDAPRRATFPLRGMDFRNWLSRKYYKMTDLPAASQALQDMIGMLDARARFDSPAHPVYCRVAAEGERICLDLGDDFFRCAVVDRTGWRVVATPPVKFRRSRGQLPLPEPVRGGSLDDLLPFVNVRETDWPLVKAWLVQAVRPRGPYPLLSFCGEQGSCKSTAARYVRSVIDPNSAPLRAEPRDVRDLAIAAGNSWVSCFDNLSGLTPWLSDALCRLSTGGGFATRLLWSDEEEAIFEAQRPVILTGIEDLASRPDLADRSLLLELPRLSDVDRQTEDELATEFAGVHGRILGALLDAVAGALRELPGVRITKPPRMADFSYFAVAATRAAGGKDADFLDAYRANRTDAVQVTLDSAPVFPALEKLLEKNPAGWKGTCAELLEALSTLAGDQAKGRYWPGSPRALSGQLRRLLPSLREVGIGVDFDREKARGRSRLVTVGRGEKPPATPSTPSAASDPSGAGAASSDGLDGSDGMDGRSPTGSRGTPGRAEPDGPEENLRVPFWRDANDDSGAEGES